jgi:predicted NBD/HSP70 family sugar kinase/transcriptional regulator with XRE-family HTH domain
VTTDESRQGRPNDDRDDLDLLLDELQDDPIAAAAWEDAHERETTVSTLVLARESAHRTQKAVADDMGTTQSAVSDLESGRVDPRLSTLQRYARAVGRVVRIIFDGEEIEPETTGPGIGGAATGDPDDLDRLLGELRSDEVALAAREDAQRRTAVIRSLAEARKAAGLTQRQVGQAMDTTQSAISELEKGTVDARLSTLQRYARATGRLLGVAVDDAAGGGQKMIASLVPETGRRGADPVLVEAARLAASLGIEDVLRGLLLVTNRSGLSVQRLITRTRVSLPTKRRTLRHLASKGWLTPTESAPADPKAWTLSPTAAFFLGVSVREDHVRGTLVSLGSPDQAIDVRRIPLPGTSPAEVIDAVERLVRILTTDHDESVMGIGVELAGPVNGENGTILFAPDLQPRTKAIWNGFDLETEIQSRLGIRTVVENDAKALATYEWLLKGAPGGLVVVSMSESGLGIGSGLVFNGDMIRGSDGESGEIGHVIAVPNGRVCARCGRERRGCLETEASGQAIVHRLGAATLAEAAARVGRPGQRDAGIAFQDAGTLIGQVLGDVMTMLNPGQLVIYGPPELVADADHRSADRFVRGITAGLSARGFGKIGSPRLAVVGPETGPLAAASVAMNSFLSNALDWAPEMDARSTSPLASAS